MVIRRVAELGHPVLRQVAEPVPAAELGSDGLRSLVADMVDTMRDYDGVGIAAPQVYVPRRLFVMEIRAPDPYLAASTLPLTVAVNPEITRSDPGSLLSWESCLSVPGLRGQVDRAAGLVLSAVDAGGAPFSVELAGYAARIVQHELDHLDGRLYLDRADPRSLCTNREYVRRRRSSAW
jgi:peptide deformylase